MRRRRRARRLCSCSARPCGAGHSAPGSAGGVIEPSSAALPSRRPRTTLAAAGAAFSTPCASMPPPPPRDWRRRSPRTPAQPAAIGFSCTRSPTAQALRTRTWALGPALAWRVLTPLPPPAPKPVCCPEGPEALSGCVRCPSHLRVGPRPQVASPIAGGSSLVEALSTRPDRAAVALCAVCGSPGPAGGKLRKCGRCGGVWYCGAECQLVDWKQNGHRAACTSAPQPAAPPRGGTAAAPGGAEGSGGSGGSPRRKKKSKGGRM